MKSPFSKKTKESEVLIIPLGGNEVVAFGDSMVLAGFGETLGPVDGPLVRRARPILATGGTIKQSADAATGAVLRLTPESQALLKQYPQMQSTGGLLGVVTGPDGRIVGQLRFVSRGSAVVATLPALAGGLALQQQLISIEKKLDRLQLSVDYLTKLSHIEIEAELAAAAFMVGRSYDAIMADGELTEDQWATVLDLELTIRTLNNRAVAHMALVEAALSNPDRPLGGRVDSLEEALDVLHAETWLRVSVLAEQAMRQFEFLELVRAIDTIPKKAEAVLRLVASAADERREIMTSQVGALARFVYAQPALSRLERIRWLKQRSHSKLLQQLTATLHGYFDPITDHEWAVLRSPRPETSRVENAEGT